MPFGSEFDEPNLREEFRFDPLHFAHLVGRDPRAPMGRPGVGEIDEWTFSRVQRLQRVKYFSAHVRRKARADLAGTSELFALVVSDDERIDAVIAGAISTNDKFLLLVEFQLDPCAAPLSRVVTGVSALGDHA